MTQERSNANESAWEGLSEGTLSKEEEALLRALAEESEDDAVRLEAYAPLSGEARGRTVAALGAQIAREKRGKVTRLWTATTATVLAAAAAAVMVLWPTDQLTTRYTLSVQGGVKEVRGAVESEGPLRVSDDGVLTLIAQPEERVREPVTATPFAFDGSEVKLMKGELHASKTGAVRVELQVREVPFLGRRELQVGLIIGREPVDASEARELISKGSQRVLSVRIVREGD